MLNELAKKCNTMASSKGFITSHDNVPEKLMLIVTELAEALEDHRAGHMELYFSIDKKGKYKPEGFGVELADAIIRILDMTDALGLDIDDLVETKMAYNAGREFMHGKSY